MLILASSSPRRRELLTKAGFTFSIMPADIDESMDKNLSVYENVKNVSYKKGEAIYSTHKEDTVIASDTIVTLDGVIYGKPKSREDAFNMLKGFSGKTHEVVSGVAILSPNTKESFYEVSYVTFKVLTNQMINDYLDTDEYKDKAGSYAIQGIGKCLIESFKGDLNNIIGLPVDLVTPILKKAMGE